MKFLFDHDVPDDVAYPLEAMGHQVIKLREVAPVITPDDEVLRVAAANEALLVTCNRDDFLPLASRIPHRGIIVLIRRRTRIQERTALVRLVDQAGEIGQRDNINFA